MLTVNRVVAIVTPRKPYFDWANQLDDTGPRIDDMRLDDLRHAYLLPISDRPEDSLQRHFAEIFDEQLLAWHRVRSAWPEHRTLAMFREWFEVSIAEPVFDASDDALLHDD